VAAQISYQGAAICCDCVGYIETHEPDGYAGHFRLRLVEFAPTRLIFDNDKAKDRRLEVSCTLTPQRFQEISAWFASFPM
jgi:hypothetical protein